MKLAGVDMVFLTTSHRKQIQELLVILERHSNLLDEVAARTKDSPFDEVLGLAAARAAHVGIECVADVGNILIDALVMRDPASYTDIVDILADEGVVASTTAPDLGELVGLRRAIVHDCATTDGGAMCRNAYRYAQTLRAFADNVTKYVEEN